MPGLSHHKREASRWTAFARGLRLRHALARRRQRTAGMTLALRPAAPAVNAVPAHYGFQVHLQPRIRFTWLQTAPALAATQRPTPVPAVRAPFATPARGPQMPPLLHARTIQQHTTAHTATRTFCTRTAESRGIRREQRTLREFLRIHCHTVHRWQRATADAASLPTPAAQLRQRLHREETRTQEPARVVSRPQRTQSAPLAPMAAQPVPVQASPAWPASSPPPLNVHALADQVMRQIDRRFVAHRERMGKV